MAKLNVGAGIANLDVPLECYPAHTQFAVCDDKYDECNVRAIAIEAGEEKILLLAYELSDIPEVPELEQKIAQTIGYNPENIIITVTHNHTSPCDRGARPAPEAERAAFRELFQGIELEASLKAATDAVTALRPARFGYGEIDSYINANEVTRVPEIGYYCDPETNGYSDKTLALLKFVDENDKLIAVLMNHCTHATFAMGKDLTGKFATSGNFTGITSRWLEDYYGDGAVVAWTSGAAGNQHPLLSEHFFLAYTDGYKTRVELPDGAEHLLMQHAGRQHAIDAVNGLTRITEYTDDILIRHVKSSVKMENQKRVVRQDGPPPRPVSYGLDVRSDRPEPAPAFVAPEIVDDPEHSSTLQMEMLILGDVAILGLGCELFCQIGRDIKAALPAKHTMVITHTPGYVGDHPHAVGYIVDKSSVDSHNHKLYRNLKPGFYDDLIVNAAKDLYYKAVENCEAV